MADDSDLANWRAQRMAQLQASAGKQPPSAEQMEQQRRKEE